MRFLLTAGAEKYMGLGAGLARSMRNAGRSALMLEVGRGAGVIICRAGATAEADLVIIRLKRWVKKWDRSDGPFSEPPEGEAFALNLLMWVVTGSEVVARELASYGVHPANRTAPYWYYTDSVSMALQAGDVVASDTGVTLHITRVVDGVPTTIAVEPPDIYHIVYGGGAGLADIPWVLHTLVGPASYLSMVSVPHLVGGSYTYDAADLEIVAPGTKGTIVRLARFVGRGWIGSNLSAPFMLYASGGVSSLGLGQGNSMWRVGSVAMTYDPGSVPSGYTAHPVSQEYFTVSRGVGDVDSVLNAEFVIDAATWDTCSLGVTRQSDGGLVNYGLTTYEQRPLYVSTMPADPGGRATVNGVFVSDAGAVATISAAIPVVLPNKRGALYTLALRGGGGYGDRYNAYVSYIQYVKFLCSYDASLVIPVKYVDNGLGFWYLIDVIWVQGALGFSAVTLPAGSELFIWSYYRYGPMSSPPPDVNAAWQGFTLQAISPCGLGFAVSGSIGVHVPGDGGGPTYSYSGPMVALHDRAGVRVYIDAADSIPVDATALNGAAFAGGVYSSLGGVFYYQMSYTLDDVDWVFLDYVIDASSGAVLQSLESPPYAWSANDPAFVLTSVDCIDQVYSVDPDTYEPVAVLLMRYQHSLNRADTCLLTLRTGTLLMAHQDAGVFVMRESASKIVLYQLNSASDQIQVFEATTSAGVQGLSAHTLIVKLDTVVSVWDLRSGLGGHVVATKIDESEAFVTMTLPPVTLDEGELVYATAGDATVTQFIRHFVDDPGTLVAAGFTDLPPAGCYVGSMFTGYGWYGSYVLVE